MLKCILLFILCLSLIKILSAQSFSLQGKVTDVATGKPLAHASIFLSNTSYGTESNTEGEFALTGIDFGKYDFVVSYVGYQTFSETISEKNSTDFIPVKILQRP